jgi:hypothetical protein
MPDPPSIDELAKRVRRLLAIAEERGEDPRWVRETADHLVDLLLELEERRAADTARGRLAVARELEIRRANAAMVAAGIPQNERAQALQARFSIGRATAYRKTGVVSPP